MNKGMMLCGFIPMFMGGMLTFFGHGEGISTMWAGWIVFILGMYWSEKE